MQVFYFLLLTLLTRQLAVAPAFSDPEAFCASAHLHESDPALQDRQEALEKQWQQAAGADMQLLPYELPVVVHIIHQNGAENITDAMVQQGMQHLNEAFANMGYYDQGTGVNTLIQFCLAQRDPDGNATTGINRVVSPLTELNYITQDLALKDLIRWDPLRYINIWLVREVCSNNGCSVAGYAYLPSAHGSAKDGIVMEAKWFGSSNSNSGVQIHEMGHYLGLYHTFEGGCTNNDCTANGDRVCDTPPDESTAPVPCGSTANSCSTDTQSGFATDQPDMFWNYMDYGDWNCYSAFTQGQADRMAFFIENVRHSLLDSDGCLDPCLSAISAGFSSSATVIDIGTTVNFTNTSSNASAYQWLIDGVPFSTAPNTSYAFNNIGTFIVSLETGNADPNCSDIAQDTIEVICPVSAAFDPTNLFPEPGEIVNFANNSSGSLNFNWTVNGVPQANSTAFSYVFPAEGAYTICLEADNGLCEDSYCQLLFAFSPSTGCKSGYLKTLGTQGTSEISNQIVIRSNGNALIGGGKGQNSMLFETDPAGEVLWERLFDVIPGAEFIRTMFIDSEGYLIVGGRDDLVQPDDHYLGKYDLDSHAWVWLRTWQSADYTRLDGMFQKSSNGNYIAYGLVEDGGNDQYILELNQATGAPVWQRQYNFGGNTDHLSEHVVVGNSIYFGGAVRHAGGGLDKIRAAILKTDLNGNIDWERQYFNTPNQNARTYVSDLLWEGDTIVALGRGSFTGSDLTTASAHLFKTDLNGNLLWGRTYTIGGGTEVFSNNLLPLPDGYVLQGVYKKNGNNEIFFIRTNKAGNVIWGKGVGNTSGDWSTSVLIHDNDLVFTGYTNEGGPGSNTNILYGRIPLEQAGQNDSCSWLHDLDINAGFIQYDYDPVINMTGSNPSNLWQSHSAAIAPGASPLQDIPGCSCVDTAGCSNTFVKTLGDLSAEAGRRIIPEPGGGFLLGGSKGDSTLLSLLDSDGQPVWVRTLKATPLPNERISDLYIDTDQHLIGTITADAVNGNSANAVFKYDYQNDLLLWIREAEATLYTQSRLLSIQEATPGGNYLLAGQTWPNNMPYGGCDATLVELDRNTGNPLWVRNYDLGSCETFSRTRVHANSVYATGRYNFAPSGADKMRPGISQLSLSGNPIWSRLYLVGVSSNLSARLYPTDLLVDNGLVVPCHGDLNGASTTDVELQLFKTDFTGNLLWARQYNIPGASSERFSRLINLPDGYLGVGYFTTPANDNAIFLMKTDKNGNLIWAREYGGMGSELGYDVLYQGGLLYLTGSADDDILLARLDLEGQTPDSCDVIQDLVVTDNPIPNPYDNFHALTPNTPSWPFSDPGANFQLSGLQEQILCESSCEDPCIIAPDAYFELLQGQCGGDSLSVTLRVCNEGEGILYAGTPVTFFDGDPQAGGMALPGAYTLPADLLKDSCLTWALLLEAPVNTAIFAWVNDENAAAFDSLECDQADNLASFTVNYAPPTLDLGPDTIMCGFGVVSLTAQPGFASYLWQDGSTAPDYTALEPGAHWVVATDSCGSEQSDTVLITAYSSAQSFDTLQFCQGDTVLLFGEPVYEEGDYTALLTGFNGCDSLSTITLIAGQDTIYNGESATICADSSVVFHGQTLDTTGVYVNVDTTGTCVEIQTLTLNVLPLFDIFENLSTCANQPVDIFGEPLSAPGVYTQTFTALNGCDSVHTIELTVLDTALVTVQTQPACEGEGPGGSAAASVSGGQAPYSFDWGMGAGDSSSISPLPAGEYTLWVTDANGCLSSADLSIAIATAPVIDLPLQISVQEGEPEQVVVVVTPEGGAYQYAWSPPTGLSCSNCPAPFVLPDTPTTYQVLVTDAFGCTAQAGMVVLVEIRKNVYIPNIFSPNADGINDAFTVFAKEGVVAIRSMKVFDRWGEKVFEGFDLAPNDLSQGWDGTFRGKPMQPGVFGYLIELEFADGIVLAYNGSLTLVR